LALDVVFSLNCLLHIYIEGTGALGVHCVALAVVVGGWVVIGVCHVGFHGKLLDKCQAEEMIV
jgi:hypothetical protein